MAEKKSTEDILAAIRGGSSPEPAQDEPAVPAEETPAAATEAAPVEESSPAAPTGPAPTGTASILDSIRGGGVGAKPAAAAKPAGAAPAAKPAGGAPGGTSDIMAAIRGGGGAAAAAPAAAAKKAEPAKPEIDEAAVSGLSVSELVKAARAGQSPEDAEQKPVALPSKPLKPPALVKPVKKEEVTGRRNFIGDFVEWVTTPIVLAWGTFTATCTIASLATARFMMPNVLVEPPTKFKIGPPTDYSPGTVSTKWKAQFGVWIVNAEVDGIPMVYALSTVCTHLGCTPNWLEGEQKFKCPCHGSGFRKTGVNFEGPAPRPLERMGIRLAPDGMLEVDKSVKFQQELGQWENPASYVPVV